MTIGQRLGQYLRHPTTGITPDGAPLDAGSAHIMHANASELSAQYGRLVGFHAGPGEVQYDTATFQQWATTYDVAEQDASDTLGRIPWIQGVQCVVFGPLHAHAIRLDGRGFGTKAFKVVLDVTKSGTSGSDLIVMAAATGIYDTPLRTPRLDEEFVTIPPAAAGALQVELDIAPRSLRPSQPWRSRDGGDSTTQVAPIWIWVGWLSNDLSGGDRVDSTSVFEVHS